MGLNKFYNPPAHEHETLVTSLQFDP